MRKDAVNMIGTSFTAILWGLGVTMISGDLIHKKQASKKRGLNKNNEIEHYLKKLNRQIVKLSKKYEKELYLINFHYDNDSIILKEVWSAMILCVNSTLSLFPYQTNQKEHQIEKFRTYEEFFQKYDKTISKYEVFYNDFYFEEFNIVKNICHLIGQALKYNILISNSKHPMSLVCRANNLIRNKHT
ncbi:hypothetical protein [Sinanaerobacter chloroacetimidivorans]|nr:hypothetical protein [Sinanaerobacter chloroacetimidivorans]